MTAAPAASSSSVSAPPSPELSGPHVSELAEGSVWKGVFDSKPNNGSRPRSEAAQAADAATADTKAAQTQAAEQAKAQPQTQTQAQTPEAKPTTTATPSTPAGEPAPGSPEARIAELEKRLGDYKKFDAVIDSLQKSGYETGDAALQALARNRQEQEQATLQEQRQTALDGRLTEVYSSLQSKYQGFVDKGVLTVDEANAALLDDYRREGELAQKALQADWVVEDMKREREALHAQQQATQTTDELSRVVAEFPILSLGRDPVSNTPGFGENIVRSLHALSNGEVPMSKLAGYVSQYVEQAQQQAVADYVAKQAQVNSPAAPPVPVNGPGGAPPPTPAASDAAQDGPQGFNWARALGIPGF
jgi:hypothetical protein